MRKMEAQRRSEEQCNDSYKLQDDTARLYSMHFAYFIRPAKVDEN